MKSILVLALFVATTASAWAQDAKPLNLKLPPNYVPAPASSTATPANGTTAQPAPAGSDARPGESVAVTPSRPKDPPGTYYGDTTGRMANVVEADDRPRCDDATYNQPQVHGSVSTGVVSGSHGFGGNYQSGTVSVSQAFGSCDHPTGGVSISVGGGTGHFNGGRIR
ncbi:MAG: hypothetical protein GAK28_01397 [Luteibacter sp.]|uniref:hypothetical protein n=1 Tax=Luteibacter sp. TaxID=1886636 RepID=UPI00137C88DC|nr:hypothetical protein [Luteibacter sp.]KAF1007921.1 MAG: hypothetical protein GAK28_01397 [Luteibacter sp.]